MPDVTVGSHVDTFMTSADATAARTAIDAAGLASPAFTGTPTAPTAAASTNTTQLATTAFVQQELSSKSYVDGEVTNYADLPVTLGTPAVGAVYSVKRWALANPLSFPGLWERRANNGVLADWERLGSSADMFADAYFTIFDEGDSTKRLRFSAGGVTAGQTRELTALDKNYTVEETGHAVKHKSGGSDAIKLSELAAPDDNTTLDATSSLHGLMPKADKAKLDKVYVKGSDVASAATVNLDTATGDLVDVTGTTTITAITLAEGVHRIVRFTGALTLTHGASLVLPGSANITTAAGDFAIFRGYATGVVRCVVYSKANGQAVVGGTGTKTYAVFTPLDNQPPAATFATLDTRNSISVLDFDDTTQESAVFVSICPEAASLASGLIIRLHWAATSATTGDVRWGVQIEAGTTDVDADSFDTAAEATTTTSATSGITTVTAITLTTIDSLAAGNWYRLKVYRAAANAGDTMVGDAELVAVEVRSAA